jgi:hypothetical protein
MIGDWFRMFEPRQEFVTPEFSRYSAECRRLASIARPVAKPAARRPMAPRLRGAGWVGSIATQFQAPRQRHRKLATT